MKQVSNHYRRFEGKKYFEYQSVGGLRRGTINSRSFTKHIKPQDSVLDFGAGDGSLLLCLKSAEKIAIEPNSTARRVAVKHGITAYESLGKVKACSIDVIVSNHTLEHVLNPYLALCEMRQKLKKNGKLILKLPIDDWRTQTKINKQDINHHLFTWTPQLIYNLLEEVGFNVLEVKIITHAWPVEYWDLIDNILPTWAFDFVCRFMAIKNKSRQIQVVAKK